MSLQDDIFDVADALKGTPEEKAFDNILRVFNETEQDLDKANEYVRVVKGLKELLK